jgi:death-on-curing protein
MIEPVWLDERDALVIHGRLLARHGGAPGIRDLTLLQSALARPRQHFSYATEVGVIELATVYTAAIVRNHPFVDGNKRVGFMLGVLFLELNGYRFAATEEDAAHAVIALADGTLDDAAYAAFLADNVIAVDL